MEKIPIVDIQPKALIEAIINASKNNIQGTANQKILH